VTYTNKNKRCRYLPFSLSLVYNELRKAQKNNNRLRVCVQSTIWSETNE